MSQSKVAERDSPRPEPAAPTSPELLSAWTTSRRKRAFDIVAVLAFSPILLPLLAIVGLAVRVSLGVPVLFRQLRIGRNGTQFVIYKFRTMHHSRSEGEPALTVVSTDHVSQFGRILRRIRLDELPQVLNVLLGEMSLVGPRPKVPEQHFLPIPCRPGLTGSATLAFAREETIFAQIPRDLLQDYYRQAILPAKYRIDSEYMRCATFWSDLKVLFDTVTGRWGMGAAPIPTGPAEPLTGQWVLDASGSKSLD